VGAIRGTNEAGGWNIESFIPSFSKMFFFAYEAKVSPLNR